MLIVRFTAHTLSGSSTHTHAHVLIASMLFVDSSMFKTTFIHTHTLTHRHNKLKTLCACVRTRIFNIIISHSCFAEPILLFFVFFFFFVSFLSFLSFFVIPYFIIIIIDEVVFLNAFYSHSMCAYKCVCVCACACIVLSFFCLFYFNCLRSFDLLLVGFFLILTFTHNHLNVIQHT